MCSARTLAQGQFRARLRLRLRSPTDLGQRQRVALADAFCLPVLARPSVARSSIQQLAATLRLMQSNVISKNNKVQSAESQGERAVSAVSESVSTGGVTLSRPDRAAAVMQPLLLLLHACMRVI